jgi:gamma-glutamyltranspeptidase/glutathione hydrolase
MNRIIVIGIALSGAVSVAFGQAVPANLHTRGAQGANGVVATAKPDSAQVGIDILKKGGNAVDAAVAIGFAQGVLEPNANGLGGGGFITIKLVGKDPIVIDFREMAPIASKPDMFKYSEDGKTQLPAKRTDSTASAIVGPGSQVGGLASGVPGDVAGLLYALENYGSVAQKTGKTMTRQAVMQPAVDWAMKVPVTSNLAGAIKDNFDKIKQFPAAASLYLKDGLPYDIGDTIQNPDLQATLKAIQADGAKAFYEGPIAAAVVSEVLAQGGVLSLADMRGYKVEARKPVTGTYRNYTIISTPPASSGGTHIIQLLNILENFDMKSYGQNTAKSLQLWGEAMRLVYADRAQFMADTAFVKVPLTGLTSKAYAKDLAALIALDKVMPTPIAPGDPSKYESGSTTSFSVMDKDGNMVACTKSINYFFGSGVVIPGTGIVMNNHMDDFVLKPGSVNSVEPKKRPLSSMSPTLVLDPQGRSFMTLGAAGATRIITAVAQIISDVVDHGMSIQAAISAPRIYRTNTSDYNVEGRIPVSATNGLTALGHKLLFQDDYSPSQGVSQGCLYDYATKTLYAGADPRRDGQGVAY